MKLLLRKLPKETVTGIYRGTIPDRMRMLHPDAADLYKPIAGFAVLSDMFREPGDSLRARQAGRKGVQPPSFSLHNYGIAIDIDIPKTMKAAGVKTKKELDLMMRFLGWYCHRNDFKNAHEAWHYNALGLAAKTDVTVPTTQKQAEALIQRIYPEIHTKLDTSPRRVQKMLRDLTLYAGEIDGKWGPLSQDAMRRFEAAWGLPKTGSHREYRSVRTLTYITAERVFV